MACHEDAVGVMGRGGGMVVAVKDERWEELKQCVDDFVDDHVPSYSFYPLDILKERSSLKSGINLLLFGFQGTLPFIARLSHPLALLAIAFLIVSPSFEVDKFIYTILFYL